MKHTMRRTKMRRAMAHISPMNHPWVAMSTCRLGTAERTDDGKQTVSINCVDSSRLKKKRVESVFFMLSDTEMNRSCKHPNEIEKIG